MKKFYFRIFLSTLILLTVTNLEAQVNSVALTPPAGPVQYYASITAAYTSIPTPPTGNYLIELLNTYDGTDASEVYPIALTTKGLLPGGFTITIRPAAGNNGETIQRVVPASGAVILINGGDNIIIDGRPGGVISTPADYLTINDPFTGDNLNRDVELLNGANNNVITYINANAALATAGGAGSRIINISTSGTANNNNTISNNIVTGGLRGIQVFGTVANNTGTVISNNTVRNFGAIGIFGGSFQDNTTIQSNIVTFTALPLTAAITGIQNQGTTTITNILDNQVSIPLSASSTVTSIAGIVNVGNGTVNILRNTISNLSSNVATSVQGIAASPGTATGVINISRNKISDISSGGAGNLRGIAMFQFSGTRVNVDNNFVSITQPNTTATVIFGLLFGVNGTTNPYITNAYYNTIRIGGTHTAGTAGNIYAYGIYRGDNTAASVFNMKNNISIMDRSGGTAGIFLLGFYNSNVIGTLDINYNTYYGTAGTAGNAYPAAWVASVYDNTQLAAYQAAATPHEANTNFTNVTFVSNTDLHLAGASTSDPNLLGTPVPGITYDIDGLTRSATTPTRGADELGVAIPITLFSFNAARNGSVNNLTWTTSQEINGSHFGIERSTDGRNFSQIGQVTAAGNSSLPVDYQFTDHSPVNGINYYRLKMVDRDNSFKMSEIRSVKNTAGIDFTFSPNPVNDVMKITINTDRVEKGKLLINDFSGKQVYARDVNVSSGNNTFNLDVSKFSNGTYIIRMQLKDQLVVKKFNKM